MLYLLYGSDTFRARSKLKDIIARVSAKAARPPHVLRMEAEGVYARLHALAREHSLFGEKRIVVCEGFLGDAATRDDLLAALGECKASEHLFLLYEVGPEAKRRDVRAAIDVAAAEADRAQEFAPLGARARERWVMQEALRIGLTLGAREAAAMAAATEDLWQLSGELEVRRIGGRGMHPTASSPKASAFAFVDAFFFGNSKRAWLLLQEQPDVEGMFWALAWQLKHALLFQRLLQKNPPEISAASGLSPYAAKKSAAFAARHSYAQLARWYEDCIALWRAQKIGERELRPGLERLILAPLVLGEQPRQA